MIYNNRLFVEKLQDDINQCEIQLETTDPSQIVAIEGRLVKIINETERNINTEIVSLQARKISLENPADHTTVSQSVFNLQDELEDVEDQLALFENRLKMVRAPIDYAKTLCDQAEVSLRKIGKGNDPVSGPESDSKVYLKQVKSLGLPDSVMTGFVDLCKRYRGGDPKGLVFKHEDYTVVSAIKDAIKQRNSAEFNALNAFIGAIESDLHKAFDRQLRIVQDIPMETVVDNAGLAALHDFYWDFNNPLEAHFNFHEFLKIIEAKIQVGIDHSNQERPLSRLIDIQSQFANNGIPPCDGIPQGMSLEAALACKMQYLKKRKPQIADNACKVVILGAGPGGLMRALTAGMRGVKVDVFEKREAFTREQLVYLHASPLLDYFGITLKLEHDKKLRFYPPSCGRLPQKTYSVQIQNMQKAMMHIVKELLGDGVVQEGCEVIDISKIKPGIQGVEDVREVKSAENSAVTGCMIKNKNTDEATWHPADLIVDASGARGVTAAMLGNSIENYTKVKPMITVIYQRDEGDIPSREDSGRSVDADLIQNFSTKGWFTTFLQTPDTHYYLIEPKEEIKKQILMLQREIAKVEQDISLSVGDKQELESTKLKLVEELKKLVDKIAQEVVLKSRHSLRSMNVNDFKAQIFRVQIGARQPASLIGDCMVMQSGDSLVSPDPKIGLGCNMAISGTSLFLRALDNRIAKGNTQLAMQDFTVGSEEQVETMIDTAWQCSINDGTEQFFNTLNFALRLCQQKGMYTKSECQHFKRLVNKMKQGIAFSERDKQIVYGEMGLFNKFNQFRGDFNRMVLEKIEGSLDKLDHYITPNL